MMPSRTARATSGVLVLTVAAVVCLSSTALAQSIRSQALVNLTFDEPAGEALDSATTGAAKDNAAFVNGAARIRSPFRGQTGRLAVVTDGDAQQALQIPDSPDVTRPDAITVSLLFASLHAGNEGETHNIFTKRLNTNARAANYGASFSDRGDLLRVYVNDSSGLKAAQYSTRDTIGSRKPKFITAVMQIGDAPAPDADEDKDDVLVRFFVDGKIVKPKGATGGTVVENDAWLIDVNIPALVNDAPLVLGSSDLRGELEYTSCVIDEFSLFGTALSPDEVAALYLEVAGNEGLAFAGQALAPRPAAPEITGLSLRGLQNGTTTVLTVTGTGLLPEPELLAPFAETHPTRRPGATDTQAEFEVATPAAVAAGHYPVRIQNRNGLSGTVALAVDSLPQSAFAESSPENPLSLPIAVSGSVMGQQQARFFIRGVKGQHFVADLECKRLGSPMDPVLELRNPRQTPIAIAWGRPQYAGDTRIETTLSEDGIYTLELHDLAYKAPRQSNYRLKIGDLKIVDTAFPPALPAGAPQTVAVVGPGMGPQSILPVDMATAIPGLMRTIAVPRTLGTVGPAPMVFSSEAVDVLEDAQPEGQIQTIDATFEPAARLPIAVSGRLLRAGETDTYRLLVKPGAKLTFSVESHALRSPLDAHLEIAATAGAILAASEAGPTLDLAVPEGISEIKVALRDLHGRGGSEYIYRLVVARRGLPDFAISVDRERLQLPSDGSAVLRVELNRDGYDGPVSLALVGSDGLTIVPTEIPAGVSKTLVSVQSRGGENAGDAGPRHIQVVAQSRGLEPAIRRVALSPTDSRLALLPAERAELAVTISPAVGASVEVDSTGPEFFRGTERMLPVSVQVADAALALQTVRFTLLTTEQQRAPRAMGGDAARRRRIQPPTVRAPAQQTFEPGERSGSVRLIAPVETTEASLECILQTDFIAQPFADAVAATVYSRPFRLNLQNGVAVEPGTSALALAGGSPTKLTGLVKRLSGFFEPVSVQLINLPEGYTSTKAVLAPHEQNFEIVVTSPQVASAADIPNVKLRVTGPTGLPLVPDVNIATKIAP